MLLKISDLREKFSSYSNLNEIFKRKRLKLKALKYEKRIKRSVG
jgi:hypothetical protein